VAVNICIIVARVCPVQSAQRTGRETVLRGHKTISTIHRYEQTNQKWLIRLYVRCAMLSPCDLSQSWLF